MKPIHLAIGAAACALAACGQTETKAPEAPAAPQSLMEQVQAMPAEQQPVFAYQQLIAYQQAHPEAEPACTAVRATDFRGVIPPNIASDSIYADHVGAAVYSVQCGQLVSMSRYEPREHWLVVFAPGAAEAAIVNCADARGVDRCPRTLPLASVNPPATSP